MEKQVYRMQDFEHHVFISYAHKNNLSPNKGEEGFVSKLHKALRIKLDEVLYETASIWFDDELRGNDSLKDTIARELKKTALLLTVLSPPYLTSKWCQEELKTFLQFAQESGGLQVEGKSRILKVVKIHVPLDKHPSELQGTTGYEFFEKDSSKPGRF